MKEVKQLCLHDPSNNVMGDCFRACIASLLEKPAEQVPHFCGTMEACKSGKWLEDLQNYLAGFGLCYIEVNAQADFCEYMKLNTYHTITGPSPRFAGERHCVVGHKGKVVFDPHPDGTGLTGDPKDWLIGFLVLTSRGSV